MTILLPSLVIVLSLLPTDNVYPTTDDDEEQNGMEEDPTMDINSVPD